MPIEEIAPSLWHWQATHPEWKQRVESYATRDATRFVLFDPLLPRDGEQTWDELLLLAEGRMLAVVLTTSYHARSTAEILERRQDAEVWGTEACRERVGLVTHLFAPPARVAGLVSAMPTGRADEVVYWLAHHRAIVTGDVVIGDAKDGATLCPANWLTRGETHTSLARQLEPLTDLDASRLLLTHGRPFVGNGQAHIQRLLQAHTDDRGGR